MLTEPIHSQARQNYILPGRFQPFHNDHLVVLRKALQICSPIVLGIVVTTPTTSDAATPFEAEARRQHGPERNPFSPRQRLEMITACLQEDLGDQGSLVFPILLPRPEANWNIIASMFPGTRTWIVPSAGEEFDEMKARFFESCGDEVMRLEVQPTTSGRE